MEQRSDTSKVVGSSPAKTTRIKMLYSSMVEQWFHKPQVAGSIPAKATMKQKENIKSFTFFRFNVMK